MTQISPFYEVESLIESPENSPFIQENNNIEMILLPNNGINIKFSFF